MNQGRENQNSGNGQSGQGTKRAPRTARIAGALVAGGLPLAALLAWAQPAAPPPAAAAPTNCKAFGASKCCEPAVAQHLPKEAIFSACGESDATFLGEKGSKDTCRYVFKGPGG